MVARLSLRPSQPTGGLWFLNALEDLSSGAFFMRTLTHRATRGTFSDDGKPVRTVAAQLFDEAIFPVEVGLHRSGGVVGALIGACVAAFGPAHGRGAIGAGFQCDIVSMGSSPTALYANSLDGITEVRAGVYMLGDLFQAEIGTHGHDDIAVTVLTSVIGKRPAERRILVDAGGIALSKDRSTEAAPHDFGFGLVLDIHGQRSLGTTLVKRANQEHGVIDLDPAITAPEFHIGDKLRIAPNHVCMTAAAHDRYFVVDGSDEVIAMWPRVNGW